MKFRRKKTPEIEAWHWDGEKIPKDAPMWVHKFANTELRLSSLYKIVGESNTGEWDSYDACWLVLEQDGNGCYPVTNDYFEDNFEEVE